MGYVYVDSLVVLLFLILGCLSLYQVGVFNIAVEAALQNGALLVALWLASSPEASPVVAVMLGTLAGAGTGAAFAFMSVRLGCDQVLSGVALNVLSYGCGMWMMLHTMESTQLTVPGGLGVGRWLFAASLALLLGATWFVVYRSRFGPRARAIRLDPMGAAMCGVRVQFYQWLAITGGGMACALGGAYLTLATRAYSTSQWASGIGFISLGLVAATRGRLLYGVGAAQVFAGLRLLQASGDATRFGVPSQLAEALPYAVTIMFFCLGATRLDVIRRRGRHGGSGAGAAST